MSTEQMLRILAQSVQSAEPPMEVGDLSAANLKTSVIDDEGEPVIQLDDGETIVNIDFAFGTVEQSILGLQRALSTITEMIDILRCRAGIR